MATTVFFRISGMEANPSSPHWLETVPRIGEHVTLDGSRWYTVLDVRWGPPGPFNAPGTPSDIGTPLPAQIWLG